MAETFSVRVPDEVLYSHRTAQELKELVAQSIAERIVERLELSVTVHFKEVEDE